MSYFQSPVAVMVGLGAKREVCSLRDMHEFLMDWPPSRRGPVYNTAVRACEAARIGHLTVEQARRAFVEFARISRILWPEMDAAIADAALCKASYRYV
ncbi:MAG: DUF982 domain-containing protein [Rhizobiales bacterium]|nr:DUF982 domain-containing protein [Hyphomicrobiales bacterium]